MHHLRLECSLFLRRRAPREFNGRWIASADTPDGPPLRWGTSTVGALWMALEPFDGLEQLLASVSGCELATPFGES